jgi:hypothetical protein
MRPALLIGWNKGHNMRAHIFAGLLAGMTLLVAAGCGAKNESAGDSDNETEATRFATADALIEYYNEVVMNGTAIDVEPLLDCNYAETPLHERLLEMQYGILELAEWRRAMWDQFESVREPGEQPPLSPDKHPAEIIERDGRRAVARQVQNDGSDYEIHLVKMEGRWWISVYTHEYDPMSKSILNSLDTPQTMEPFYNAAAKALPPVTRRIRNGEFQSAEQADQAMRSAMAKHAPGR